MGNFDSFVDQLIHCKVENVPLGLPAAGGHTIFIGNK